MSKQVTSVESKLCIVVSMMAFRFKGRKTGGLIVRTPAYEANVGTAPEFPARRNAGLSRGLAGFSGKVHRTAIFTLRSRVLREPGVRVSPPRFTRRRRPTWPEVRLALLTRVAGDSTGDALSAEEPRSALEAAVWAAVELRLERPA